MENIAVFAPMPRASERTATAVTSGVADRGDERGRAERAEGVAELGHGGAGCGGGDGPRSDTRRRETVSWALVALGEVGML
jgi:hypothetical protein